MAQSVNAATMAMLDILTEPYENSSSLVVEEMGTTPTIASPVKFIFTMIRMCCLHPLGILGSVLTVLLSSRNKFGSREFTYCIMVIAIADGLHLSIISAHIIPRVIEWSRPGWFCKMTIFSNYFTTFLSDNMCTLVALERAVAIILPHKVKLVFTWKRLLTMTPVVLFCIFLINIHLIFTLDINGLGGCATIPKYLLISQIFFTFILLNFMVCFVTSSVCAILIIYKLKQRRNNIDAICTGGTNNDSQITAILLSIVLLYVITTLPLLISWSYKFFIAKSGQGLTTKSANVIMWLNQFTFLCKDLGHVSNFYLYCLSSSMFRRRFFDLILSCMPTGWKCRNSE